jgi:hypothetical protein
MLPSAPQAARHIDGESVFFDKDLAKARVRCCDPGGGSDDLNSG